MAFEWGDKVVYVNGMQNPRALFLEIVNSTTCRIILEGRISSVEVRTSYVKPFDLPKKAPMMPPFTFQRGARVKFEGQVYIFEVEYKDCYVIGREHPETKTHRLYYDNIGHVNFIKAPKKDVSAVELTNQNMKHLLEGN